MKKEDPSAFDVFRLPRKAYLTKKRKKAPATFGEEGKVPNCVDGTLASNGESERGISEEG